MKYPFEADENEILAAPEKFVSSVFSSLASEFLVMPKGEGYIEYGAFESGYEALKLATKGFQSLSPDLVFATVLQAPVSLIVCGRCLALRPQNGLMLPRSEPASRFPKTPPDHWTEKYVW